jgi:prevent-host-death family protein
MLDITKDIQSLTTFRRNSGEFIRRLRKSKRPLVLTVRGKAQAIVQDAEAYQRLLDTAARADVYEAIRQGLDDVAQGRTRAAREIFSDLRRRHGIPRWNDCPRHARPGLSLSADSRRWIPRSGPLYNGLEEAIYTLERFPRRCPVAPEARKAKRPMRHLLYGAKPHAYRVLYEIDEPNKAVHVLTIRHGAMDEFIAEAR